jgi:hypothetical protein
MFQESLSLWQQNHATLLIDHLASHPSSRQGAQKHVVQHTGEPAYQKLTRRPIVLKISLSFDSTRAFFSVIFDLCRSVSICQIPARSPRNDITMADDLRKLIKEATIKLKQGTLKFVPDTCLASLMKKEVVIRVLEESQCSSRLKKKIPIGDLADFIIKDAYKVFATLLMMEKPHLIEQFYGTDFRQDMLPVRNRTPEDNDKWEVVSYGEQDHYESLSGIFSGDETPWDDNAVTDFCDYKQWQFVIPVFTREKFRYNFPDEIHLPFIKTLWKRDDGLSEYSWMEQKSIHIDHIWNDPVRRLAFLILV